MNNMLNFDVVYINAIPMLFENGTSTHTCVDVIYLLPCPHDCTYSTLFSIDSFFNNAESKC